MKKHISLLLFVAAMQVVAGQTTITSFSPTTGRIGEIVTIVGTGFNTTAGVTTIEFGEAEGVAPESVTSTEITVQVPADAVTGVLTIKLGGRQVAARSATSFTLTSPSITGFSSTSTTSPTTGRIGEVITITGAGFSAVVTDDSVSFGGTSFDASRAAVAFEVNSDGTELKVRVPTTAQNGKVRVKVSGTGDPMFFPTPLTSTSDFTLRLPSITSFTPTEGRRRAVITITGEGFEPRAGNNSVSFGGTSFNALLSADAFEVNSDGTELKVRVPATAQSGKVSLRVGGDGSTVTATSTSDFTFSGLRVERFSPMTARIGEVITIEGQGFSASVADNEVSFGAGASFDASRSVEALEVSSDGTEIKVQVPRNAQDGSVIVRIGDLEVTSPGRFALTALSITEFSPTTGRIGEIITITIRGTGFDPRASENEVSLAGASFESAFEVNSDGTELKVRVPVGVQNGRLSVRIGGSGGPEVTSSSDFTFTSPSITSFTPATARTGEVITITGENFSAFAEDNGVTFGGTSFDSDRFAAAFEVNSDGTEIKVQVPGSAQNGKVTVQVGDFGGPEVTSSSDFTFTSPSITSFTPATARTGEIITITGTSFSAFVEDNGVSFGRASSAADRFTAAFEVNSDGTEIKVRVPEYAKTGELKVRLGGAGGPEVTSVVTSTPVFTFIALSIASFTPTTARIGEIITIRGTGFDPRASENEVFLGEAVLFSSTADAFEVNSNGTEIKVRVPAAAQNGKVSIRIGGFGSTAVVTSASDFTFTPPSITSFSPTTGRIGEIITITGEGFEPRAGNNSVSFGGTSFQASRSAAAFEVNSDGTELKVRVPAAAQTGKVRIELDGTELTSVSDFTFTPPSITSFSPTEGRIGQVITITGEGFSAIAGGNYVHFGGQLNGGSVTSAHEVNTDGTEIKVRVPTHARSGKIAIGLLERVVSSGDFTLIEGSTGGGVDHSEEITAIREKNTEQDSKITANEDKNTEQDQEISAIKDRNTAQDSKITANEDKNTAQDSKITANEDKNTSQDSKITANEDKNTAQDSKITANEDKNTSQDSQIADLLARIRALEGASGGGGQRVTVFNVPKDGPQSSRAYPNPAYRSLQFANLSPTTSYTYKIYASTGQLVLSGDLRSSDAIDISRLLAGQYILTLQNESGSEVLRSNLVVK